MRPRANAAHGLRRDHADHDDFAPKSAPIRCARDGRHLHPLDCERSTCRMRRLPSALGRAVSAGERMGGGRRGVRAGDRREAPGRPRQHRSPAQSARSPSADQAQIIDGLLDLVQQARLDQPLETGLPTAIYLLEQTTVAPASSRAARRGRCRSQRSARPPTATCAPPRLACHATFSVRRSPFVVAVGRTGRLSSVALAVLTAARRRTWIVSTLFLESLARSVSPRSPISPSTTARSAPRASRRSHPRETRPAPLAVLRELDMLHRGVVVLHVERNDRAAPIDADGTDGDRGRRVVRPRRPRSRASPAGRWLNGFDVSPTRRSSRNRCRWAPLSYPRRGWCRWWTCAASSTRLRPRGGQHVVHQFVVVLIVRFPGERLQPFLVGAAAEPRRVARLCWPRRRACARASTDRRSPPARESPVVNCF